MELLRFNECGIYCEQAQVYIDPWKPVDYAIITHGHGDHARYGNKFYKCTHEALPVIRYRLGDDIKIEGAEFGETFIINGVKFSFHRAGHILGSAQVRVEYKGEVWVASGDYKTTPDPLAGTFEPVKCHTFITESTFGLPVYKWSDDQIIAHEINDWWKLNKEAGKVSVIAGYSLGKAQRILQMLDNSLGEIYTHGAIENINEVIRKQGISLNHTTRVTNDIKKGELTGNIVIATPSALSSPWMKRLQPYSTGIASGWMSLRGARRRRSVDRGFILSDHADWNELNTAIKETGAEKIYVTHGYTSIFSQWLNEQGYEAKPAATEFEGELGEINEASSVEKEVEA